MTPKTVKKSKPKPGRNQQLNIRISSEDRKDLQRISEHYESILPGASFNACSVIRLLIRQQVLMIDKSASASTD